jgi:hypothetical protein
MNARLTGGCGNIQSGDGIIVKTQAWGFEDMLKISLIAMFLISLATLSVAASYMPVPVV